MAQETPTFKLVLGKDQTNGTQRKEAKKTMQKETNRCMEQ